MPYTIQDLTMDILPRVGRIDNRFGITIYGAANSILSMVYKKLLERHSDILASGNLSINIPAYGYYATLPDDLVALAEKPRAEELFTDWMGGTVTAYDPVTGAMTLDVNVANGTDTLTTWNIATNGTPEIPSYIIGSSSTSLTVGVAVQTLMATPNMAISVGDYLWLLPTDLPSTLIKRYHHLAPTYLDDDLDHAERTWWEWYGIYGNSWEPPSIRPRHYKIIGTTIYVRPKVIVNNLIKGRYFAKPTSFTVSTDIIPWNGFFDEIFREGSIRILQKGISIPEADPDFALFLHREFDQIINARISLIPSTRRTHRGDFM